MAEKKTTGEIVSSTQQGGVVRNTLNQVKLIARLIADKRVNLFAKLIPLGALAYLFFPFDGDLVLPVIGLVDDAMLLWLGTYVFVEICPPEVVEEHKKALEGTVTKPDQNEIVDAEVTDVKDETQQ
jgi:uncharacterized membrane protein YkvA (DUF1232 family)